MLLLPLPSYAVAVSRKCRVAHRDQLSDNHHFREAPQIPEFRLLLIPRGPLNQRAIHDPQLYERRQCHILQIETPASEQDTPLHLAVSVQFDVVQKKPDKRHGCAASEHNYDEINPDSYPIRQLHI